MRMLALRFVKWVIIANIIVWPLAYYGLENWLSDFAYRIDVSALVFLIAAGVSVLLAILAVSYHVLRAAVSNPIESIRYE